MKIFFKYFTVQELLFFNVLKDFRTEIANHKQEYKSACNLAEQLMNSTDAGHEQLQDQLDTLHERWERLNSGGKKLLKEVENQCGMLGELGNAVQDAQNACGNVENQIARTDAQDSKALNKLKSLLDEVNGPLKNKVKTVQDLAGNLKSSAENADSAKVDQSVGDLQKKSVALSDELKNKIGQLETAADVVKGFKNDLTGIGRDLRALEHDYMDLGGIARDPDRIKSQIEQTKDFLKLLDEKQKMIDEARKRVDELRSQGFDADADALEEQLNKLQEQLDALREKGENRLNELLRVDGELRDLLKAIDETHSAILDTLGAPVLQKPISVDLEDIKHQLDGLKVDF